MQTTNQRRCCNAHKEVDHVHSSMRHILSIPIALLIAFVVLGTLLTTSLPTAYAHTEKLVENQKSALPLQQAANKTWYFAEGSVGNSFNEFLTIFNPNSTVATVTDTYLFQI